MKIGLFCNEYPPRPHGGIGTFVQMLSQGLLGDGHEVTVVQFGEQTDTSWVSNVRLVTLQECKIPKINWLINRFRLWIWLRAEAKSGKIDIFELPDYQGWFPLPVGACPTVVRLHLAASHIRCIMGERADGVYLLERATLNSNRNWIGVSNYILEETKRFFSLAPISDTVIYNPAPLINIDNLPDLRKRPAKYLVYVGSVSDRKGALLLARAMREIFAQYSDVHLVYVGPETEFCGLPISVEIHGILNNYLDRLLMVGQVSHEQALVWIKNAYALVFVSQIESFGLVVTESMTLGVPVICAESGPGPELINNGENGVLINAESKDELVQAIASLLNNQQHTSFLGKSGQLRAIEEFTLAKCVSKTVNFYKHILQKH